MGEIDVLLVDGHDDLRQTLLDMLEVDGYSAAGARSEEEGWRVFEERRPRAVVTAERLEWGSGMALARRIKEASPKTRVVLQAASAPAEAWGVCDWVLEGTLAYRWVRATLWMLEVRPRG